MRALTCQLIALMILLAACGTFEMTVETPTPAGDQTAAAQSPTPDPTQNPPATVAATEPAPVTPAAAKEPIDPSKVNRVTQIDLIGRGIIWSVAVSPDGSTVAAAGSAGIWLYSVPALEPIGLLEGHAGEVFSISWSPDGNRLVSGGGDNTVRVWNLRDSAPTITLEAQGGGDEVAWSPDGAWLASKANDGTVTVWDVSMQRPVHTWERETECMAVSIAWLPNSAQLGIGCSQSGGDGRVTVRDANSGSVVRQLDQLSGLNRLAWSPDGGRLASGGHDGKVRVWDSQTGVELVSLPVSAGSVGRVTWSRDGSQLAWGLAGGGVEVWTVGHEQVGQAWSVGSDSTPLVDWSADGLWLVSVAPGMPGRLQVWEVANSSEFAAVDHGFWASAMAWSEDGRWLAAGSVDGTVTLWSTIDARTVLTLSAPRPVPANVLSVSWSPDSAELAVAYSDTLVRCWGVSDGALRRTLDAGGPILGVGWSPDGRLLAAWGDTGFRLWNAGSGDAALNIDELAGVRAPYWSAEEDLVVAGANQGQVWVWHAATGQVTAVPEAPIGAVRQLAWSPDGARLAVAGDLGLAVWDRTTAELTLGLQEFSLLTAAWSPDGSHIAAGTDFGQLLMYDVASADQVFLRSVGSSVLGLAWSPGGDMVASASDRIRLWDPATGAVLSELGAASIGSTSVDWSPDGVYLASGGSDRVIRVWGVADE